MNLVKILFLIAVIGHLICGVCDCLITYVPGGKKLDVTKMSDNKFLSDTFANMPLRNPLISMLAGCFVFYSTIFCGQIGYMADFIPTFCVFPLIIGRPCGIVLPQREKTIFL